MADTTDRTAFEVYCDGVLYIETHRHDLASSIYNNVTGLHKEMYRHDPGAIRVIMRKQTYGVQVKA